MHTTPLTTPLLEATQLARLVPDELPERDAFLRRPHVVGSLNTSIPHWISTVLTTLPPPGLRLEDAAPRLGVSVEALTRIDWSRFTSYQQLVRFLVERPGLAMSPDTAARVALWARHDLAIKLGDSIPPTD